MTPLHNMVAQMEQFESNPDLYDAQNTSAIFIVESNSTFKEMWNYGVFQSYCAWTNLRGSWPSLFEDDNT